jgi:PAS domain S-box-containing protein
MEIELLKKALESEVMARKVAEHALKEKNLELHNTINELVLKSRKLHDTNSALNEAQALSHLGSWKYIIETGSVTWSKELFNIFDYPIELGAPNYPEHKLFYTKESFLILDRAVNNCIQNEIPYDIELDVYIKKAPLKHVIARGSVLKDNNNKIIGCYGTAQDVTERKLVQNELDLKSKKLLNVNNALNLAQKLSHIGSWSWDAASNKIEWSDEIFHIWGLTPKKGTPNFNTLVNQIHIDDQELFNNALAKAINLGTPYDIKHRICLSNDKQKIIRGIGKPIFGNNGKVIRLEGTTQDITEQKLSSTKIEEAKEMYRLLADNTHDIICLQEPDSTFKYISPSIKNLMGYEQEELVGKQVFNIVHPEDVQALKDAMKQGVLGKKDVAAYTFRVRHKEGHFVWLEFLTVPVFKGEEISYYVTSTRDITQWVLAKQKIQEYQKSLQKLTTEITLVEEKQKKEIATNIHDQLSQCLIISKMKINELKKNPQLKIVNDDLKFIETHISEALENSRKITYELSPPVLYQLGIIDALNWLLDEVEATHKVKCRLHSNVSKMKLDDVKSILLYRSIQEVINNAIKYASASLITLDVKKNEGRLDIIVTDNGVGFNSAVLNNQNHSGSGFGLFTVRERIRNIQGKFIITSEINTGTTVSFFIPMPL